MRRSQQIIWKHPKKFHASLLIYQVKITIVQCKLLLFNSTRNCRPKLVSASFVTHEILHECLTCRIHKLSFFHIGIFASHFLNYFKPKFIGLLGICEEMKRDEQKKVLIVDTCFCQEKFYNNEGKRESRLVSFDSLSFSFSKGEINLFEVCNEQFFFFSQLSKLNMKEPLLGSFFLQKRTSLKMRKLNVSITQSLTLMTQNVLVEVPK